MIKTIHNRPSNEIFSYIDLETFLSRDTLQSMSVVGNAGNVYFLSKLENFDGFKFFKALTAISQPYKDAAVAGKWERCIKIIESLIERAEEYGLEFIRY